MCFHSLCFGDVFLLLVKRYNNRHSVCVRVSETCPFNILASSTQTVCDCQCSLNRVNTCSLSPLVPLGIGLARQVRPSRLASACPPIQVYTLLDAYDHFFTPTVPNLFQAYDRWN